MRKITLMGLFLVVTFVVGCQNTDFKERIKQDYQNSIGFFNDEFISHFPIELPDSATYKTNVLKEYNLADSCFGTSETMLWKKFSSSIYTKYFSIYDSLAKDVYSVNDSSLLLIFSYCDVLKVADRVYKNQEPPERQALAKHNVTIASSLPVPLFEIDEYKGKTISGLTEDFKLHVLDAKPGKYIDDKYLQECKCLPEKWQHGYSKGVALSDKQQVIIYWVIVW